MAAGGLTSPHMFSICSSMNAVVSITAADTALDPSMARAEARLRDLEEVRGVCMFVARMVQKEALALDEPPDDDELTDQGERIEAIEKIGRVVDRVARSVRLTVILEEKVEKIIRDVRAGRRRLQPHPWAGGDAMRWSG